MDPLILILIAGGGIAFLLLVAGIVITATSERSLVEERLGRYVEDETAASRQAGGVDPDLSDNAVVHLSMALSIGLAMLDPITTARPTLIAAGSSEAA